ncbi:MAG: hypothetical protein ACKVJK_01740 [Methylophagaceae bacterium]|jgi:hypothetical protein|tara:strand:+ start:1210 stop:1392 length:183 start_codon:yes stop_codon:yes gene_type:complete
MANTMVGTKSLKLDRITGLRADGQNGVGIRTIVPVIKSEKLQDEKRDMSNTNSFRGAKTS